MKCTCSAYKPSVEIIQNITYIINISQLYLLQTTIQPNCNRYWAMREFHDLYLPQKGQIFSGNLPFPPSSVAQEVFSFNAKYHSLAFIFYFQATKIIKTKSQSDVIKIRYVYISSKVSRYPSRANRIQRREQENYIPTKWQASTTASIFAS